jgi:hypothetical protein
MPHTRVEEEDEESDEGDPWPTGGDGLLVEIEY